MKLDEINMPIFLESFKIAYKETVYDSDEAIEIWRENLKKQTNLTYHLMIETALSIKG